jgi:flagellar basal-body rod protein FlgB
MAMSDVSEMLVKTLDGTALRQKVLAHNLANLNTPGYVRQDVDFRQTLAAALGAEHGTAPAPRVYADTRGQARPDGNNVTLQQGLGCMNENGLLYDFATKALASKQQQLLTAIRGH